MKQLVKLDSVEVALRVFGAAGAVVALCLCLSGAVTIANPSNSMGLIGGYQSLWEGGFLLLAASSILALIFLRTLLAQILAASVLAIGNISLLLNALSISRLNSTAPVYHTFEIYQLAFSPQSALVGFLVAINVIVLTKGRAHVRYAPLLTLTALLTVGMSFLTLFGYVAQVPPAYS